MTFAFSFSVQNPHLAILTLFDQFQPFLHVSIQQCAIVCFRVIIVVDVVVIAILIRTLDATESQTAALNVE